MTDVHHSLAKMSGEPELTRFLAIPEKARCLLLDYLTVWDLMNLRLVCRATKCWVETSDALQQMVVQVKERGFLMKLVKSGVNWSNLSVICDASDLSNSWINSKDYLRTFAKLSTSLRVLSLDEHRLPIRNGLEMILAKCTTLEKLKIGTLDLKNTTPTALATAEEMVRSLGCLKELRVTYLAWDTEQDLHGFSALLEGCVNLKLLKMPYILTASLYSMYPSSDDDVEMDQKLSRLVETVLFQPTVTHLLQRSRDRSCLKYLDVDNFDLDNLLETIVPACQKCGCLLLNVQELLEQPLPCTQKDLLADTIGSLRSCTSNLDLTSLAKLKRVHFTADSEGLSADIDKKHDQAVLTSLQSITLTLTSNPILASARLASCFLHQRRETVEKVSLGFDKLSGAAQASVFKVVTFSSCFPHLRHLTLDGYDGKTENYLLLWKNFLLLQRLKLHNCTTLDDFAFVGKDESKPAFLQLTRLKELTVDGGAMTNAVIENVISRLSLQVLSLAIPQVTFQGLSSLPSRELRTGLVVFHCMKPDDCSEDRFKQFFKSFENLKKHDVIF